MAQTVSTLEWRIADGPVGYDDAVGAMQARVAAIRAEQAAELVWLLEHPPLYTAGTSARPHELLEQKFPVFASGRGGQFTYHGPGQRVAYVMLDLRRRVPDIRRFVTALEAWIIGNFEDDVHVAARAAARTGVSDAAQRHVLVGRHARGNLDDDLALPANAPLASTFLARRLDDSPFALAGRTGRD